MLSHDVCGYDDNGGTDGGVDSRRLGEEAENLPRSIPYSAGQKRQVSSQSSYSVELCTVVSDRIQS